MCGAYGNIAVIPQPYTVSRFMKRFHLVVAVLFLAVPALAANIVPSPPQLAASAYLLMDADSGEILVENVPVPEPSFWRAL